MFLYMTNCHDVLFLHKNRIDGRGKYAGLGY